MRTMKPAVALPTVALLALLARGAGAAPPPPPGGHHPIRYGGDNRTGYPALNTVSVEPDSWRIRLTPSATPNPFRSATVFRFTAPEGAPARVRLFSASGQRVREWFVPAGERGAREIRWDARDARGRQVPTGLYLFEVTSGRLRGRGKVVLLR